MPSMPRSSPPMKKPVTCSRPSRSSRLVLKKPLRIAYTALNSPPALKTVSPRFTRRRAYTTFSMRSRSSSLRPAGRHSSRRLQLEQVNSNLRGAAIRWMAVTACIRCSSLRSVLGGRARGDDVAHALEVRCLVEETLRAQPRGELPVRLGAEAGQHVEHDVGRRGMHRAQHVQAVALREP